jgi:hypothetical protein
MSVYTGAGVLIVDTARSSILLVHDYTEDYNCCGGQIESDGEHRIVNTASKELYEETRTLISCDPTELLACPFVDVDVYRNNPWCQFRCYLLKITNLIDICDKFAEIRLTTVNRDFYETKDLAYFPLKQFLDRQSMLNICETMTGCDELGNKKRLNQRVISVIQAAIEQNLFECVHSNQ